MGKESLKIEICRADPEDANGILALQKIAYQSEALLYDDWSIPPLTQTELQIRSDFAAHVFLKAVYNNRIIGSVRAVADEDTCRIGRLIVAPDFQRNGTGTRLLLEIESFFRRAARFELFTGSRSLDNIRLYDKLGYRVFREEDLSENVHLVFMEKHR